MKTLTLLIAFFAAVLSARAVNIVGSSTTTQTITISGPAYDLNFDIHWSCDDFPQQAAQGKIELLDSTGIRVAEVLANDSRVSGPALLPTGSSSTSNVVSSMAVWSADGSPADGDLTFTWNVTGLAPGTYTLQMWNYTSYDSLLHATTVWTTPMFLGGSTPTSNQSPTIAWTSTPGTVADGQSYTISAHGNDADGNLTQISIGKNGQPFAQAGGGNGTDGDASDQSTDSGPQTITYTAQATDATGATSATITQTVTVAAPGPVQFVLSTSAGAGGSVSAGGSYDAGTGVTISASPDATHDFAGWSGDATGTANPVAVVMDRNKTVQANFVLKAFTLTTSAMTGGSATPGGSYPYGTMVTLSAAADAAHYFTGWSGDASGTASSVGVLVDRAKFVQAQFAPKAAQAITFSALGGQSVGATLTLAASATSGLPVGFVLLGGPATLSGNQLQVTGPGAITLQAVQPGDSYTLAAPPVTGTINAATTAVVKYVPSGRTWLQDSANAGTAPFVLQ